MQIGQLVVGTTPVPVPVNVGALSKGVFLLSRYLTPSPAYIGMSDKITTTTGSNLLPKGDYLNTTTPYFVPAASVNPGQALYLVAELAGTIVDWYAW